MSAEAAATAAPTAAPEPEFAVLGAAVSGEALAPAIAFDVHVVEPTGRHVHVIALSAQIMIEPARRAYDDGAKERLVELFGPPERWATTTRNLVWHRAEVLVPAFTGATTFRVRVPCSLDLEVASATYLYGLGDGDGDVPLAFNFNGTVHYRDDDGRLQMAPVPWSCSAAFRMPARLWCEAVERRFAAARWVVLGDDTLRALLADKARRGAPTIDAAVAALLAEAAR